MYETVLQGEDPAIKRSEGKMTLTIPAWGMHTIGLKLAGEN
jgi:hypothetical protein